MKTNKNKAGIIKRLIDGDAYAFDEIYQIYNKKIYAFSLKNLKNKEDAEGVVQELFIHIWKDRKKLKEIRNLDSWIFTVSFNIIRRYFRKMANERFHLRQMAETKLLDDNTTITEVEYNELLKNAEKIIEQLPSRQRTVFLLSKIKGLSNTEISLKLNISKKTVENHLSNARAFLKKAFVNEKLLTVYFFWFFINVIHY